MMLCSLLSSSLALALNLPPAPQEPQGAFDFGDYHALVIGNAEYKNHPDLETSLQDAREVHILLEREYGFESTLLLNATRQSMVDALWDLAGRLDGDDNLLIYYAGHGELYEATDRGYWLGVDAGDTPSKWLSVDAISETLKANPAKHILVVSDSCYSGKLTRGIGVTPARPSVYRQLSRKRARTVLTAGGLEPVSDSGTLGHSAFAFEFLRLLRENIAVLDGARLYTQIRRPVMLAVNQTPEYGDVRGVGHEGGDFLFVRPGTLLTGDPVPSRPKEESTPGPGRPTQQPGSHGPVGDWCGTDLMSSLQDSRRNRHWGPSLEVLLGNVTVEAPIYDGNGKLEDQFLLGIGGVGDVSRNGLAPEFGFYAAGLGGNKDAGEFYLGYRGGLFGPESGQIAPYLSAGVSLAILDQKLADGTYESDAILGVYGGLGLAVKLGDEAYLAVDYRAVLAEKLDEASTFLVRVGVLF